MAYREKWVMEVLGKRSVLDVALDVHGTASGSIERNPTDQINDVRALKRVISTWVPNFYSEFDSAVHTLVMIAVMEAKRREY